MHSINHLSSYNYSSRIAKNEIKFKNNYFAPLENKKEILGIYKTIDVESIKRTKEN